MKNTWKLFSACVLAVTLVAACKKTKTIIEQPPAPNYADSVKVALWGYYPLNGNFGDSSGSNHAMTGMNGIAFGNDKTGTANTALLFDGVNDFAFIDQGKTFPEGDFTVSFWMYPQKTTGGRIFNKADYNTGRSPSINFGFDDDNASNKITFSVSNNPNVCGSLWTAGSATNLFSNTLFTPNNWYHIVAEHVGGVERIYMNGKLIAANTTALSTFKACSDAPWYFGIWWTGGLFPYKGIMDNIRIYTRALSDQEISWLNSNYK